MNVKRPSLRNPAIKEWFPNSSLVKRFYLSERWNFSIRGNSNLLKEHPMVLNLSAKHKPGEGVTDPGAPMPAGPIIYREDGQIDWENMWDSYCTLALDGGPPHRADLLKVPSNPDVNSQGYSFAMAEIIRGIRETTGMTAVPDTSGWCAITCQSPAQARWLAAAILEENVESRSESNLLFVPVGDQFQLKQEIKNVITAVAKTSHYWNAHLASEVKHTLALQEVLNRFDTGLRRLSRRLPPVKHGFF
jgi:sirohydrochlorin cobaltochelatase